MATFLGLDLGTSATKALLINEAGDVLSTAVGHHETSSPEVGFSEQQPAEWWRSTIDAIAAVTKSAGISPETIDAVGPTGQMHGLVTLDGKLEEIRPAILWNDQRSAPQCVAFEEQFGIERLIAETGNRMLPGFTAPKLLWMRENEPEEYARIEHVLLPKDYIRFKLSGELSTDVSDASGTSVFACGQRKWSDLMLDALAFPRSWWPEAHESPSVTSTVSAEASAATGLRQGVPIVAGAGDQAASALGMGLVGPGIAGVTLGTSGVVFAASEKWRTTPDGSLHAFCHAVPNTWHVMGVILSAAGSYKWFNEAIAPDLGDPAALDRLAQATPVGAEGLFYLPYLNGERTPHPDPHARGCFIGLSARHTRGHLARAVLEGVTHALRESLDLINDLGINVSSGRISGGGAASPLWRQLVADLLGLNIATTTSTQGTAYGAALLAAVGGGAFESIQDACAKTVHEQELVFPGDDAAFFAEAHTIYTSLYPALAESFKAAATIRELSP